MTIALPLASRRHAHRPLTPYALWGAQILLALTFGFAGAMKFIMSPEEMTRDVDLPIVFLRFIGIAEILGAIGLIAPGLLRVRPALTPLAAAGLLIIMVGAVVITAVSTGVAPALFPLAVGLVAAFVVRGRWSWLSLH